MMSLLVAITNSFTLEKEYIAFVVLQLSKQKFWFYFYLHEFIPLDTDQTGHKELLSTQHMARQLRETVKQKKSVEL